MVLIDNFIHYVWVYPLKYKSDTFLNFTKFHKLIHTQFNRTIKSFQWDLGGEFENNEFKLFALSYSLVFRFSFPQTSQQNERVEQMICCLNDISHTFLTNDSLPYWFWVEALYIATYLNNILPAKRLNFSTPVFSLMVTNHLITIYAPLGVHVIPTYLLLNLTNFNLKLANVISLVLQKTYLENLQGFGCLDPSTGKLHVPPHFPLPKSLPLHLLLLGFLWI